MIPRIDAATLTWLILLALLVLGGTLRLTRFVVTDSLGGWMLRDPAQEWADRNEKARRMAIVEVAQKMHGEDMTPGAERILNRSLRALDSDDPISWQARLVSGLYCPFCVGFWIGAAVVILTAVLTPLPIVGMIWVTLLVCLTLNYIVGHLSSRID